MSNPLSDCKHIADCLQKHPTLLIKPSTILLYMKRQLLLISLLLAETTLATAAISDLSIGPNDVQAPGPSVIASRSSETLSETAYQAFKASEDAANQQLTTLDVIGEDTRYRVKYTDLWPYKAVGLIVSYWSNGSPKSYCTGTLVGAHVVLTAGHCIYQPSDVAKTGTPGWLDMENSIFFPALNDCNLAAKTGTDCDTLPSRDLEAGAPFYGVGIKDVRVHKKHIATEALSYDYGVLVLKEDIGKKLGWYGLAQLSPEKYIGMEAAITGYPGDKQGRSLHAMWQSKNQIKSVKGRIIEHVMDAYVGMSGAPVRAWMQLNGRYHVMVVGIHIAGKNQFGRNSALRVDDEFYRLVTHWIDTL